MSLLKPRLSDFGDSVLKQSVVVFVLLALCHGGQSQVSGTSQPVVAMIGDDVTLPCHLDTAVDATNLAVEWARPDLKPRFVHLRRDGVEHLSEENPWYRGRTSLTANLLKCGDVSLKLSKVKPADAGSYKCIVPKSGTESVVKLTVGSVSSANVEISKVSSEVLLVCESAGWYPEPEVLWLDGEGNLLSAGPTETVRGPDDLYTVSSRVTVEKRHSSSFTCRVQQQNISQTRETQITVPADLFMVQSGTAVRISIFFIVWILSAVAVCLVFWKVGPTKTKTTDSSTELQPLMGGEGDGWKLMTKSEKIAYLDNAKGKVDEESQKNEAELKHVEHVIKTLTEQKKNLKNQREKLILILQEDKVLTEENKKKLKEKTKMDKERKMAKREKTRDDLKKRREEHDELLKNTDKLLETTEEMIIKMTERKGKLERDKEKIDQRLKEIERQKDEIQRKIESEKLEREKEDLNQQVEETERQKEENQSSVGKKTIRGSFSQDSLRREKEAEGQKEEAERKLQPEQSEREDGINETSSRETKA